MKTAAKTAEQLFTRGEEIFAPQEGDRGSFELDSDPKGRMWAGYKFAQSIKSLRQLCEVGNSAQDFEKWVDSLRRLAINKVKD